MKLIGRTRELCATITIVFARFHTVRCAFQVAGATLRLRKRTFNCVCGIVGKFSNENVQLVLTNGNDLGSRWVWSFRMDAASLSSWAFSSIVTAYFEESYGNQAKIHASTLIQIRKHFDLICAMMARYFVWHGRKPIFSSIWSRRIFESA